MRSTLITQFSWDYRYGFNSVLNGLDYYDNKLDVHCLYDSSNVPDGYVLSASNTFPFIVKFYHIDDFISKYPPMMVDRRWIFEYYKWKLALELVDQYDSFMITDCDYLVLSNLEPYLASVIDTNILMTTNNPGWVLHYNEADTEEYKQIANTNHNFFPIMSSPFICATKRNVQLFEAIWDMGKVQLEHLNSLTRVILLQDRTTDVISLEGTLWCDPELRYDLYRTTINGKRGIYTPSDRLMMCHGRFWARTSFEGQIVSSPMPDRIRNNINILCDEMEWINTNWKVKLPLT